MFEENEIPVTEEVTENVDELTTEELVDGAVTEETTNVEQPTEEVVDKRTEKKYSDEDLDAILAKKLARKETKIRKEYEKKYGRLETTLKAGTGKNDLEEITNDFNDFYTERGIEIPQDPYSNLRDEDLKYLADKEASEIIDSGLDEVIEETDRLADLGLDNLTPREKMVFTKLATYRKNEEAKGELRSVGVDENILKDEEFKAFTENLNPNLPIQKQYELYRKLNPKKELEKVGSMKNGMTSGIKEHYTMEEISKLTSEQLDDPKVWDAVLKSMTSN